MLNQKRIVLLWMIFLLTYVVQSIGYTQGRGKIYWTEDGQIRRANLNGTNVESIVTGIKWPKDIALDVRANKMYWVSPPHIYRANLNGSDIEKIVTGMEFPDEGTRFFHYICKDWRCNGEVRINDGDPIELPHRLMNDSNCIALDAESKKLYWGNNTYWRIRRANNDGSNMEVYLFKPNVDVESIQLDVKEGRIYFVDSLNDNIARVNLNGTNYEHLRLFSHEPRGFALDLTNRKMYWTHVSGEILRASLNAENVETLITGLTYPGDIVLDTHFGKMYWVEINHQTDEKVIKRANMDGSEVETIYTSLKYIWSIALDTENIYGITPDTDRLTTTWANVKNH